MINDKDVIRHDNNTPQSEEKSSGIVKNPNPRANENIDTKNADHESNEAPGLGKVGTEITDGEDG